MSGGNVRWGGRLMQTLGVPVQVFYYVSIISLYQIMVSACKQNKAVSEANLVPYS